LKKKKLGRFYRFSQIIISILCFEQAIFTIYNHAAFLSARLF